MKVATLREKLAAYPDDAEVSAFHALVVVYVDGKARAEDHLVVTYGYEGTHDAPSSPHQGSGPAPGA